MAKAPTALKRLLLGRPMSSGELHHTLLPKIIALPIFSSDALSSVAYASQEIILVLTGVSLAAIGHVMPISLAVASLLVIVVISYRQTVRAYPSGGGAYIVAHENLGTFPGLLAASALMIDYILTVSVSITAGADAVVSAVPDLAHVKVELCIAFILFITLANLRGVRESGILFSVPTYGFVISIYILIITGFVKCIGGCPPAESAHVTLEHTAGAVSIFILLRAFAAGTSALTGVEAISNGVPAFRYPQSRNAATTLAIMGTISVSMFLGISWLAHGTHVVYTEELTTQRTVIAQIAAAMFANGWFFYVIQVMTAAILILAANTAYQDFPRLASILARDRFMPRQFLNRGDRLVFSNGILILAVFASGLIWAFRADINHLIQLYLVGVFISFTLSQFGMVVHWRKTHEPGWRRSAFINLFGGSVTAVVLCVVVATKFSKGAWIVIVAIPLLLMTMRAIHSHYRDLSAALAHPERRPPDKRPGDQHLVIYTERIDAAAARAVGYARSVRPKSVTAITTDTACQAAWSRLAPEIPIETLNGTSGGSTFKRVEAYLEARRAQIAGDDFLTVITPEVLQTQGLGEVIRHPALHRLKAQLVGEANAQVMDIPVLRSTIDPTVDQAHEPGRNYAIVLLAGLHNASLQAIEYAETLRATDIRAVSFGLDPEETERLGNEWLAARIPHPLEIDDSPFRDIGISLIQYIRPFEPDGIRSVVTVVIPEFIVTKRRHHFLHGKTALIVKRHLLFEPGVITVSVPYRI
ncbi:MAG TPA: APC family permease [Actinomycetota bacterium]|nr:APC family permease [Actinomycetota bacterium]